MLVKHLAQSLEHGSYMRNDRGPLIIIIMVLMNWRNMLRAFFHLKNIDLSETNDVV